MSFYDLGLSPFSPFLVALLEKGKTVSPLLFCCKQKRLFEKCVCNVHGCEGGKGSKSMVVEHTISSALFYL
mgnify:CR=1 FL=1